MEPSQVLRAHIEQAERNPERLAAAARVKAVIADPRAVHFRDRIAAALRYSRTGMLNFGPEHALPRFMFYPDRARAADAADADRLLAAFDHVGLRLIDDWQAEAD